MSIRQRLEKLEKEFEKEKKNKEDREVSETNRELCILKARHIIFEDDSILARINELEESLKGKSYNKKPRLSREAIQRAKLEVLRYVDDDY